MTEPQVRRIVVIGGSAGAIEPLLTLAGGLRPGEPAAFCVAVHLAPYYDSHLPSTIRRASALPSDFAADGEPLESGKMYVAPPDHHLLVQRATLRLTHGPRENRARPAVDPLFRSAALTHGSRVIGVLLSGALDDGTAGLWTIKDLGGVTIVQDPADAAVRGMPSSAIANVSVDHVVPSAELGPLISRLIDQPAPAPAAGPESDRGDLEREIAIASLDDRAHASVERYGVPSRFACPDCGGVLWRTGAAGPLAFRCEVGHAYAAGTLADGQSDAIESALWASLRALEDKAALARVRASDAQRRDLPKDQVTRLLIAADAAEEYAAVMRELLGRNGGTGTPSSLAG